MDNLLELYCVVDDFLKDFLPQFEKTQLESGQKRSRKSCSMSLSEIMTIMIYFHQMRFRDFKSFYTQYLKQHLKKEFPQLLSYNRFIELMPSILISMCAFIQAQSKTQTGIYFPQLMFVTLKEPLLIEYLKELRKKVKSWHLSSLRLQLMIESRCLH